VKVSLGLWVCFFALLGFGVFTVSGLPAEVEYESEVQAARTVTVTAELPESLLVAKAEETHQQFVSDLIEVSDTTSNTPVQKEELLEALTYANSALLLQHEANSVDREYVLKTTDRIYDRIGDIDGSGGDSIDLSDLTLSGTTYVDGRLGIGTSSSEAMLAVAGSVYLADTNPADPTNSLYNNSGDLYWNGSILSSSTASVWSAAAGDVFRSAGNVAIGTSTISETLTVDGTARFTDTTIAPIVDAGGQVCNVEAYGAVGDNSTLNDAAIAAAIADCPEGGIVYFPMGEFRISTPIVLDRPITLRGAYSPRWSYSSTPRSSIRADFGSFAGVALVHVRDRTISGEIDHNNGGRLEYMSLDGGSAGTNVDGIYFEGLVRDWKLTDVDISQTTGNGFEAAVGTGSGNPRGFTIRGLSIYSADGHGFRATALNDSFIDDLLAVGNSLRGIYLSSMGETKVANSRAVFNGLSGLYIDGATANGGISFTDFSTDRNDRHGVRISASGTSTIIFNGLLTRRDGPNTSGGSETPYAGVTIIGSPTEKVAPVFISGLGQTVGIDDQGNPPLSPSVGVRVTNATYVKIDGQLWGIDEAWQDDGGNDYFIIEEDAILKTGTAGAQELFTSDRNWKATSTGALIYDGQINIGSSTDARLLNIVAPSQAGARFRDTTNNVIFDMRAEDFQGFFGTFSNHQLRFQTNNTSRLTIGTNGDIGIGTTSPTAQLHTTDDVRFGAFGAGTLQTDANGNVSVSSDERLKDIVGSYDAGLAEIIDIDPILYRWNEESGYDTQTVYAGFSAQNVALALPEAVGEDKAGFLTLSDRPILAAVVVAVQDMWDTITGNTARIQELEERINTLEAALVVEVEETESDEVVVDTVVEEILQAESITGEKATTSDDVSEFAQVELSAVPDETVTDTGDRYQEDDQENVAEGSQVESEEEFVVESD